MPLRNLEKEQRQPSLVLHLSNAETNNAFGLEMAQVLKSTIETMRPQALVLTHRGPVFCSGGNLKHYASLKSKEEGVRINRQIRDLKSLSIGTPRDLPISTGKKNGRGFLVLPKVITSAAYGRPNELKVISYPEISAGKQEKNI